MCVDIFNIFAHLAGHSFVQSWCAYLAQRSLHTYNPSLLVLDSVAYRCHTCLYMHYHFTPSPNVTFTEPS
eukprot:COSAG01_NODE_38327_length_491_cov_0.788265_1_plen_69_part_10